MIYLERKCIPEADVERKSLLLKFTFSGLNLNSKNSVVNRINRRRKKSKGSVEKVTGK